MPSVDDIFPKQFGEKKEEAAPSAESALAEIEPEPVTPLAEEVPPPAQVSAATTSSPLNSKAPWMEKETPEKDAGPVDVKEVVEPQAKEEEAEKVEKRGFKDHLKDAALLLRIKENEEVILRVARDASASKSAYIVVAIMALIGGLIARNPMKGVFDLFNFLALTGIIHGIAARVFKGETKYPEYFRVAGLSCLAFWPLLLVSPFPDSSVAKGLAFLLGLWILLAHFKYLRLLYQTPPPRTAVVLVVALIANVVMFQFAPVKKAVKKISVAERLAKEDVLLAAPVMPVADSVVAKVDSAATAAESIPVVPSDTPVKTSRADSAAVTAAKTDSKPVEAAKAGPAPPAPKISPAPAAKKAEEKDTFVVLDEKNVPIPGVGKEAPRVVEKPDPWFVRKTGQGEIHDFTRPSPEEYGGQDFTRE